MKSRMIKVTVFATLTVGLLSGCGDSSHHWEILKKDSLELPGKIWQDSKDMVKDPQNLGILLVAGGASGYVRCAHDDEIARHFDRQDSFSRDMTISIGTAGNPGTHFALAGAGYLYGLLTEDEHTRGVSSSLLEALSTTGLMTLGLKTVAQDYTPNDEWGGWPSGHTSSTVTVATVLNEYYGPWLGIPMFGLSGMVMYERMDTGEHWASDVIFGAAIGYTVGRTVAGKERPRLFGMDVLPFIDPASGSSGVALAKRF